MIVDVLDRITWIIVLLIFMIPISYCTYKGQEADNSARILCIEHQGNWRHKTCLFETE